VKLLEPIRIADNVGKGPFETRELIHDFQDVQDLFLIQDYRC
jgi:hypothetical protein